MKAFSDVSLTWKGKPYRIPANGIMPVMARVEDIMTLDELLRIKNRGGTPFFKIAMCYGTILRSAGAEAADEEVFASMFRNDTAQEAGASVVTLLSMMVPQGIDFGMSQKEAPAGNVPPAAARTSKRRTSSRSAKANG